MNIYFIDYENTKVHGLCGLEKLGRFDKVIIFYSENAQSITIECMKSINATKAKVQLEQAEIGRHDFLDFQLSSYLGYMVKKHPHSNFFIVSEDKGYECLTDFWKKKGVTVNLIPNIANKAKDTAESKPTPSANKNTVSSTAKQKKKKNTPSANKPNKSAKKSGAQNTAKKPERQISEPKERQSTLSAPSNLKAADNPKPVIKNTAPQINPKPKEEAKPEIKSEIKPEVKSEIKSEIRSKVSSTILPQLAPKAETKTEISAEPKEEVKTAAVPETPKAKEEPKKKTDKEQTEQTPVICAYARLTPPTKKETPTQVAEESAEASEISTVSEVALREIKEETTSLATVSENTDIVLADNRTEITEIPLDDTEKTEIGSLSEEIVSDAPTEDDSVPSENAEKAENTDDDIFAKVSLLIKDKDEAKTVSEILLENDDKMSVHNALQQEYGIRSKEIYNKIKLLIPPKAEKSAPEPTYNRDEYARYYRKVLEIMHNPNDAKTVTELIVTSNSKKILHENLQKEYGTESNTRAGEIYHLIKPIYEQN